MYKMIQGRFTGKFGHVEFLMVLPVTVAHKTMHFSGLLNMDSSPVRKHPKPVLGEWVGARGGGSHSVPVIGFWKLGLNPSSLQ